MRVYQDRDADIGFIKTKKIAIIGYGNQGRAHALNLRDSGVAQIVIGARPGASADKAKAERFPVEDNVTAVRDADVVVLGAPDEKLAEIYARDNADPDGRLRATFELIFLSGWAPHESQQKPLKPGSAQVSLADVLRRD